MKTICTRCGKAYDISEWARCPTCAMEEYKRKNPYERAIPTPWAPWWTKDKFLWCKWKQ